MKSEQLVKVKEFSHGAHMIRYVFIDQHSLSLNLSVKDRCIHYCCEEKNCDLVVFVRVIFCQTTPVFYNLLINWLEIFTYFYYFGRNKLILCDFLARGSQSGMHCFPLLNLQESLSQEQRLTMSDSQSLIQLQKVEWIRFTQVSLKAPN